MLKGGCHMTNDQAVFSFELNESLYFEKGQEVDEIRGISLDPEISIQPFHDYISIRGVIELRGEYVKTTTENAEQNEEPEMADDHHAKRFVEQVMDTEDGEAKFSHQFPVEISVPSYRVENLDEVKVDVDSFDYELSEKRQLVFTSTIAIYGINEQEETPDDEKANTFIQDADQTFDFDIKEPQQDLDENPAESVTPKEYQDMPTLSNTTDSSDEESSSDRWKNKKSQSLTEFLKQEPEPVSDPEEPEQVESSSYYDESSYDEQNQLDFEEDTDSQESVYTEDQWESSSSSSDDTGWENRDEESNVSQIEDGAEIIDSKNAASSPKIYENREPEKNEATDVSYLSDMFRDEEEHFSSMRVCIVQERDTLEQIADRYNISTLNLINRNHLEDDTVSEGQLLYIPEKKK